MTGRKVEDFSYAVIGEAAASSRWQNVVAIDTSSSAAAAFHDLVTSSPARDLDHQARAKAFDQGRREGVAEGRRIERCEQSARLNEIEKKRIEQLALMSAEFAAEREGFIHSLEPQVVELALRIAERIVRHEVAVDPLMLITSVRVALGQLGDAAVVRMRVPAADADLWTETLEHLPNLRLKPEIIADGKLETGECKLETSCGRVDLGIVSQLREIERNLLDQKDRLPQQPNLSPAARAGERNT